MNTNIPFSSIIILLLLISCQRDDSDTTSPVEIIIEETSTFFDSHFIGKIVNEDGNPLEDVKVTIGNVTYLSSESGVFIFSNVKTNSAGELIRMHKKGYFDQYLYVLKSADQYSNLTAVLRKKSDFITIAGSVASDVTLYRDVRLGVPPLAFAGLNGDLYIGQVRMFTNVDVVNGALPVRNKNLSAGIFTDGFSFRLEFETWDGLPLKIVKPLLLKSNHPDMQAASLDTYLNKWITISSGSPGSTLSAEINQDTPYMLGKINLVTKVTTRIVNTSDRGVSCTALGITSQTGETWQVQPDQNGYVSFYAPSNTSLTMTIKDVCGKIIGAKSIIVGSGAVQTADQVVLEDDKLTTVQSNIDPCGLPLSQHDLVHLQLIEGSKRLVLYQSQANQTFIMPACMKVEKATYYRGDDEKYTVSFSGQNPNPVLSISGTPLCIQKVSGYFSVNDEPVLLDMNQYFIYREVQSPQNVVISDLSGFMISVGSVTTIGKYKPDAVFFNHPSITDCQGGACNDITVYVDEISQPGAVVRVRVEGTMQGNRIKGAFTHILKN